MLVSSLVCFLQNDRYPISDGEVHVVPYNGTELSIDISKEGVPLEAYEVTLYVFVNTGYVDTGRELGYCTFSTSTANGTIERKLFFRTYEQSAHSYNSENIDLPVGKERTVKAQVHTNYPHYLVCRAQVTGYRKPPT